MQALLFALKLVLGVALPLAVQLWDRKRLSPAQREACWNGASWAAALYAFGPASMLGWFWVTRGTWRGPPGFSRRRLLQGIRALGAGVAVCVAMLLVSEGVDWGVGWALGVPP